MHAGDRQRQAALHLGQANGPALRGDARGLAAQDQDLQRRRRRARRQPPLQRDLVFVVALLDLGPGTGVGARRRGGHLSGAVALFELGDALGAARARLLVGRVRDQAAVDQQRVAHQPLLEAQLGHGLGLEHQRAITFLVSARSSRMRAISAATDSKRCSSRRRWAISRRTRCW